MGDLAKPNKGLSPSSVSGTSHDNVFLNGYLEERDKEEAQRLGNREGD